MKRSKTIEELSVFVEQLRIDNVLDEEGSNIYSNMILEFLEHQGMVPKTYRETTDIYENTFYNIFYTWEEEPNK